MHSTAIAELVTYLDISYDLGFFRAYQPLIVTRRISWSTVMMLVCNGMIFAVLRSLHSCIQLSTCPFVRSFLLEDLVCCTVEPAGTEVLTG